jgi:hypothetical protein
MKDVKEKESSSVWSTERVKELLERAEDLGIDYKEVDNPFHENEPELRRGNIIFEYTEKELEEIKKCANDVVYFSNNYCKVMTDDGIQQIKLRDYQIQILKQYQHHRKNVFVSPRQSGKCFLPTTKIELSENKKVPIYKFVKSKRITFLMKKILYRIYSWLS